MAERPEDVSESELAVLQVLWARPAQSTRQIAETLHGKDAAARYPTVQKQLERLEQKGFVLRDRTLMVHLFSAAVGREELIGRRVDLMIDTLCGGSLTPVITHLLRAPRLSSQDRKRLQELVEQMGESPKSRGNARKRR
jgi:predicted transcriptional regulator